MLAVSLRLLYAVAWRIISSLSRFNRIDEKKLTFLLIFHYFVWTLYVILTKELVLMKEMIAFFPVPHSCMVLLLPFPPFLLLGVCMKLNWQRSVSSEFQFVSSGCQSHTHKLEKKPTDFNVIVCLVKSLCLFVFLWHWAGSKNWPMWYVRGYLFLFVRFWVCKTSVGTWMKSCP